MPKEKVLCVNDLRHAEYYGMQGILDDLYERSKQGEQFHQLMEIILSKNNIMLAYRNIKANKGSQTPGTDRKTMKDIEVLSAKEVVEKVRYFVTGSKHGYRPKPVRRKEIEKPNGGTRPLGIPCIWDRLIQQCFKQVLEPILEAKFSNNSYGFRPNRSAAQAISKTYALMQRSNLHHVIEFDIKGFFDNVDHSKLIRQLWTTGVQDKSVLFVIKRMLTAPIKMPDGSTVSPSKGTPQGGIISPLLANVVLNELDHWVESQWENNPVVLARTKWRIVRKDPIQDKSYGYVVARKTKLKEIRIVRYADDFRIFCKNRETAEKTLKAVTDWLKERLRLEVSKEKTRIVNTRKRYMEFLGFKIGLQRKRNKYVVKSHICDKKFELEKEKLLTQAKKISRPDEGHTMLSEIKRYDSMVTGIQNYFEVATCISLDCRILQRAVMVILTNRLKDDNGSLLAKEGGHMTVAEAERYGKSKMVRYVKGEEMPIYPIGYVRYRIAKDLPAGVCSYSKQGREKIHQNLRINTAVLGQLREEDTTGHSLEYADCRLSLFSAQQGKCQISGEPFTDCKQIAVWLIKPTYRGGQERYQNMVLVNRRFIPMLEAVNDDELGKAFKEYGIEKKQITKINDLRRKRKKA